METALIAELVKAVWREVIQWRKRMVALMMAISFLVLGVGFFWPEHYETDTLLYADVTNIIQPLLKGRAEVTAIDRSKEARELIYTRKILKQIAESVDLLKPDMDMATQEAVLGGLRSNVKINNAGKNFLRIVYNHKDPDRSFTILNAVVDAFIKDTADRRRKESRDAYEFIEQQVEGYKRQLVMAERQLKDFRAKNLDGTEASVAARITQLRTQIVELKLTVDEIAARRRSLNSQLKQESEYLDARGKLDDERNRLAALKQRLAELRLKYQETYPDIISLKEQVEAQEKVIEDMNGSNYVPASNSQSESPQNPLYEELRLKISENGIDLRSQRKRLETMEQLLEEEYVRAGRIASRDAELSELVRDYDVTREIYEEMLGRKEKARLSMTLDIEGQGISYKIQEPAVYPLVPSGIKFSHFAIAGPIVGFLLPLGLMIAYVLLDPRIRSSIKLRSSLPAEIELLAVIPHVNTSLVRRLQRADIKLLLVCLVLGACSYGSFVYVRIAGLL